MSSTSELLALAKQRLYSNYRPADVVFVRGNGVAIYDTDDKRYLDLAAGVAVCSVGHAHPKYVQAVSEQVGRIGHVSNYFYNEPNIRLADELCKRSGFSRAFFCNSGAEANEALLKVALHYHYGRGDKTRQRFIAFENAFHGRTLGSLAVTGTAKYREGFGSAVAVTHVPYGDEKAVSSVMGPDVAAILVEPIQGEGGVVPAREGFLPFLGRTAGEHGALFLVDEVQTGIGRLGTMFGFQRENVRPDAISLAKGLGGGCPIGAMLTSEGLAGALPPGTHGSTFGGNPIACAAALSVLQILDEEGLVERAATNGEVLGALLGPLVKDFPSVCEGTRGTGLLRGLVLRQGFVARDVLPLLLQRGVLLTAAGERVLRFSPPLVVSEAELVEGVTVVRDVLAELGARTARSG